MGQISDVSVLKLASDLISIPSVTENEYDLLQYLSQYLEGAGLTVERMEISPRRYNIFAYRGAPKVCFTSHVDTVPALPTQFEPMVRDGVLYGRGACDTKGIIAAMICSAFTELKEDPIALLFVVGEEDDGIGAQTAARYLKGRGLKFCVNGEPTEGKLALGHKGGLVVDITTSGVACHSGYPELGDDANQKMFSLIEELSVINGFEEDDILGPSVINFGVIRGGSASNVISDSCRAEIMIRVVQSPERVKKKLEEIVADKALLQIYGETNPVKLKVVEGFETIVVSYCSDIPHLLGMGAEFLMYGPGSIIHAHTDQEHVRIDDLDTAVSDFAKIYRSLSPSSR